MTKRYKASTLERRLAKLKFREAERIDFYNQLIALTNSGVSKDDALEMIWRVNSREGKKQDEALPIVTESIIRAKKNGKSFAEALKPWVPKDDVMIFEAIENTQDFGGHLLEYLETVEKKKLIRNTILKGLLVPVGIFGMIYYVMGYFSTKVVPTMSGSLPMEKWEGPAAALRIIANFSENYAQTAAFTVIGLIALILFSLPRWTGFGRAQAEGMPIYSLYRMYTGLSFLMAMASLLKSGMAEVDALNRLYPAANPYVKSRILKIREHRMNGANLGAAMSLARTNWPDERINLNIKIFAETQDLSQQLSRISKSWLDQAVQTIAKQMGVFRMVATLVAFVVIMSMGMGIYGLQSQVSAAGM